MTHGEELYEAGLVDDGVIQYHDIDNCLVGVVERFGQPPVLCYDRSAVIRQYQDEGMSEEEALEHFYFNVIGGWVGEHTPAFITVTRQPVVEAGYHRDTPLH